MITVNDGLDLVFAKGMWVALAEFLGQRLKHGLGLCDERGKVLIKEPFGLITGGLGVLLLVRESCLVDSRGFVHQSVQSFIELFVVKLSESCYVLIGLRIGQAGAFFELTHKATRMGCWENLKSRARLRLDFPPPVTILVTSRNGA